jgi:hypothetical protein
MNMFPNLPNRRSLLKGVTLGAGGLLFAPLLQKIAAAAEGNVTTPKRVIFLVFDNGFREIDGTLPEGVPLESDKLRQIPLKGLKLPLDLEPFAPFQDRLTILHGLRGNSAVDHGGFFAALTGIPGNKHSALGISIDAAVAQALPAVFPLLGLGVENGPTTAYCSSAWGAGKPIAMQCRPEMAYESLFGSVGATRNDFAIRKNLLDFVSNDLKRLGTEIAGPERELLEAHLEAFESLSNRNGQLSDQYQKGTLNKHAPKLPAKRLESTAELAAAQCDIAAAALIAGLTNVVTISSGLGGLMRNYTGIPGLQGDGHGAGHGGVWPQFGLSVPFRALSIYHNYLAQQAARMLTKLQETKEGTGTMLDNTLLVFMSDSANQQHSWKNANWPVVLVGNLGGKLKSGQFVSYPVRNQKAGGDGAGQVFGTAHDTNPHTNALYATLLTAVGKPCDSFNMPSASSEAKSTYAPLPELLNV